MADTTITLIPTTAPSAGTTSIPHSNRLTADDALQDIVDYFGGVPSKLAKKNSRRAITDALREVQTAATWAYFFFYSRINIQGAYQIGTIEYKQTSGSFDRELILSDGIWPDWAAFGLIRVAGTGVSSGGTVIFRVDRRISDTQLQLKEGASPGEDIVAGTSYTLSRDEYPLPVDFISMDNALIEDNWGGMVYVRPQELLNRQRYIHDSFGQPIYYTVTGHEKIPGRMAVRISPPADRDQTLDFLYRRKARAIQTWDQTAGTVSVDHINFPRKITIAGGTFTRDHVGSVIRLSSNATDLPTALTGENPFEVERNIEVWVDANNVEVDEDIQDSYTGVAYFLSDPIDLDDLYLNAFTRSVERQGVVQRIMKNQNNANAMYLEAVRLAMESDARIDARRVAGLSRPYRQRLADMPRGPDIS